MKVLGTGECVDEGRRGCFISCIEENQAMWSYFQNHYVGKVNKYSTEPCTESDQVLHVFMNDNLPVQSGKIV